MAETIASYVQLAPSEIVFIDSQPFRGLSSYLHCEVERGVLSSQAQSPADETRVEELKENEQRVLFVVEKSKEAEVIDICRSLGYPVRRFGLGGPGFLQLSPRSPAVSGVCLPANQAGEMLMTDSDCRELSTLIHHFFDFKRWAFIVIV